MDRRTRHASQTNLSIGSCFLCQCNPGNPAPNISRTVKSTLWPQYSLTIRNLSHRLCYCCPVTRTSAMNFDRLRNLYHLDSTILFGAAASELLLLLSPASIKVVLFDRPGRHMMIQDLAVPLIGSHTSTNTNTLASIKTRTHKTLKLLREPAKATVACINSKTLIVTVKVPPPESFSRAHRHRIFY
jgi:hypothetical protein